MRMNNSKMTITRRTFLKGILAAPVAILLPKIILAESKIPAIKTIRPDVQPKFYLEVSARRSGKTMRLAKNMAKYIDATNKDVYLITPIIQMKKNVLAFIPNDLHSKVKELPINILERRDLKMYFEEPGLIKEPWKQVISDNAYYAGTPQGKTFFNSRTRKFEDNFLWKLAKLKPKYEKYTPYNWMSDDNPHKQTSMEWKKDLSNDFYRQEYKAKFI